MTEQAAQFVGGIPANYDAALGALSLCRLCGRFGAADHCWQTGQSPGNCRRHRHRHAITAGFAAVFDSSGRQRSQCAHVGGRAAEVQDRRTDRIPAGRRTALPFEDGAFDALVCQFGVMFFPDKDKAYRETYRVLSPGGCYHFNVWDSFEFNPFARVVHETVAGFFTPAHSDVLYSSVRLSSNR